MTSAGKWRVEATVPRDAHCEASLNPDVARAMKIRVQTRRSPKKILSARRGLSAVAVSWADTDAGGRVSRTAVLAVLLVCSANGLPAESVSLGTPAHGSLRNGVSLPHRGDGFVTYSRLGNLLGRQYVHSRVRDTLLAAFSSLHAARPERVFVLGETGFKSGGRFRPHRTHQNGLSVDVFMPVHNAQRRFVGMPTAP
jgi:penicillin-insensitive murein endopeptidase